MIRSPRDPNLCFSLKIFARIAHTSYLCIRNQTNDNCFRFIQYSKVSSFFMVNRLIQKSLGLVVMAGPNGFPVSMGNEVLHVLLTVIL